MRNEVSKSLSAQVELAEREFRERFGRQRRWLASAPGRVNLIGEHTDYNDGFVLPMAIDRHVLVAADAAKHTRLYSSLLGQWADFDQPIERGHWASYVQGVLAGFRSRGVEVPAFEAVIVSDLPMEGGLSSSAALEVATATLIEAITGQTLDPLEKALLCQKAEHDYAGVPCGIMDQCSSVMGRSGELLLLDCRSRQVEMTPLSDPEIVALIINSNVKRSLTEGGYAARRRECESAARACQVPALRDLTLPQLERQRAKLDEAQYRRAHHVITENERVLRAAEALRKADWGIVGELMYASHASLRDDFEVSCPELDLLVDLARGLGSAGGVIGSRMTGGGFGGCTINLVRARDVDRISQIIGDSYHKQTGRTATLFATRPADGARVL